MKIMKLAAVAVSAAFFIVATASAQQAGTTTKGSIAIGKGIGNQGFAPLVLGAGQIAIGQSGTEVTPSAIAPTGDVTISAAGVTAIGAGKVTYAMLSSTGFGAGVLAWLATPSSANLLAAMTTKTGTGNLVFGTSPNITTPTGIVKGDVGLGNVDNTSDATKWAATKTLTNTTFQCNGTGNLCTVRIGTDVTGLGTGIATALGVNIGTAGAPVINGGALGTPSSGSAANLTGLPLGSITGFATGIATWLGTPSSANLAAALTDKTGTGLNVFANAPSLTNPDVTTQATSDNSTKAASTAYVTAKVAASTAGVSLLNGKSGALTFSTVKRFITASGTYTPTTGMVQAEVSCRGSGGGGGAARTTSAPGGAGGAGGGQGSLASSILSAATIGASQTVTIGSAGTGGAAGANDGTAGGDVSFGTLVIGKGGGGGGYSDPAVVQGVGGAGGIAGTGTYFEPGQPGGGGAIIFGSAIINALSGFGGGFGGAVARAGGAGANAVANTGGGGSGGAMTSSGSTGSNAGGNGATGYCLINETIIN